MQCLHARWVHSRYCSQTKQSWEKILTAGFEPRAAGWEARMLPLCYAAPQARGFLNQGPQIKDLSEMPSWNAIGLPTLLTNILPYYQVSPALIVASNNYNIQNPPDVSEVLRYQVSFIPRNCNLSRHMICSLFFTSKVSNFWERYLVIESNLSNHP